MANKIIQLSDGTDNMYTREYYNTVVISSAVSGTFDVWNVIAYRVGDIGFLFFNLRPTSSLTRESTVTIATIPTGFRPVRDIFWIAPTQGTSSGGQGLTINANGTITLYYYGAGNDFIRGMVAFPVAR